jgi:hypothetical protein
MDNDLNFQEKKVFGRGQRYCSLAVIQGYKHWKSDSANAADNSRKLLVIVGNHRLSPVIAGNRR